MDNVSREKDIEKLDYSTKDAQILLREFLALLHEVSTNYEMTIRRLENDHRREIDEIRNQLKYFEENSRYLVRTYKLKKYITQNTKSIIKLLAKFTFRVMKKIADVLGIKERIKQSNWYGILSKYVKKII